MPQGYKRCRTEYGHAQTPAVALPNLAPMNSCPGVLASTPLQHPRKLSRDTVHLVGDLLPLVDFIGVLLAAWLAALIYAVWIAPGMAMQELWNVVGRAALAGAVLAPLILCERAYVSFAIQGQTAALVKCYAVRFLMFAAVVAAISLSSAALISLPLPWLALWFVCGLALTALTRWLLVASLRRLERSGVLTEVVAVVGRGAVADRLIERLRRQTRGNRMQLLGPFFDAPASAGTGAEAPVSTGSISDLQELGKRHRLDWIVLALVDPDDRQVAALVHRLKSLAAPIGLCAPDISDIALKTPVDPRFDHADTAAPAASLHRRWKAAQVAVEPVLPSWILTLLGLPMTLFDLTRSALRGRRATRLAPASSPLRVALDDYDLDAFVKQASAHDPQCYDYVVTPNADHLIRLHREASFRDLYADASYVLLDSRFVSRLTRAWRGLDLPVCTGSDLTAGLFDRVIAPTDHLVLIGGDATQAKALAQRYGLQQLAHFNPPMGFVHDPEAVEACLQFIEAHSPFRYCLLAVGSPQQEVLAQQLKLRGRARGMALCIGASINFLTGDERRAPRWMQRAGIEWVFRLLQAPRRMARRYLVRGPLLFGLLRRTKFVLRAAQPPAQTPPLYVVAMPTDTSPNLSDRRERIAESIEV